MVDYIGFAGAFLTTISFIPQVVKIHKTKSADDVSLYMFILFTAGIILWLIYGIKKEMLPVIVANSITLILSLAILVMKIKYKK